MHKTRKIIKKSLTVLFIIIAGLLIIPFLIPITSAQKAIDKPFENSYFVNIENMRLHYRYWKPYDKNSDKWVLLVHGMGGSTYTWELNAQKIANEGFNVIAVDVPPYGYSDKFTGFNHSVDNRASLLLKFISYLNPNKKWNLIGHSMGGGIVQSMAIISPEKIDKVVFVAPALILEPKVRRGINIILLSFTPIERISAIIGERIIIREKRIAKMLESAFGQEPTQKQVDEYYKALSVPGTAKAYIRSFTGAESVLEIDGSDFESNSLIVLGAKDEWIPNEVTDAQLKSININKKIIIEDAGHCPMETHPEYFNKLVIDFFNKNFD